MAHLLQFKRKEPTTDQVEIDPLLLQAGIDQLAAIRDGTIKGLVSIISVDGENDQVGTYGTFAQNLQYAIYATHQHVSAMMNECVSTGAVGRRSVPSFEASISKAPGTGKKQLPARLRRVP